ncbi:MAG: HAD-IA family hydrolase [Parafilimonas terrae]|jgi:HAD superfamily hydrolase (TIGR01509 family)|nr:HAD-IA family hydrolase [Parafilimonas terrae]
MPVPSDLAPNPTLIFDCDGVLIDSEILVCRLVSEELTALGYPISVADVIARFAGRPEGEMLAEIEADRGAALPDSFLARTRARTAASYETELRAVPGVAEVLGRLRVPACVASSSAPGKLRQGLAATGLLGHFGGNVISAVAVARGKPAPDVFLYAVGWMRSTVQSCIVVEDSVPGVTAARAAGIRTFGFTGGGHCATDLEARLRAVGAEQVFSDMGALERLVPAAFAGPLAA